MTLLTTEKMEVVQKLIFGDHVDRFSMEGETFSIRCPKCGERAWGFDDKPEYGNGGCPYCNATIRLDRFAKNRLSAD